MLFDNLVGHSVYHGVEWTAARAYEYILAGNGLFKRARSPMIAATVPIYSHRIAGLPDLKPGIQVFPGRIPGTMLAYILAHVRGIVSADLEAMYQLRLAQTADGLAWKITAPTQTQTATQVSYTYEDPDTVICDLHSHCDMGAFFSPTDNTDEQGFRFYAVIGRIHNTWPEIALRLGIFGDFIPLPATILFTDPGPFVDRMVERSRGAH